MAETTFTIRVRGDSDVRRAINGITNEAKRAEKAMRDEAKRTAAEKVRAEQSAHQRMRALEGERRREAQRSAREEMAAKRATDRAAEKAHREEMRRIRREAAARQRASAEEKRRQEQLAQQRAEEHRTRGRLAMTMGGAALGGAMAMVGQYRGAAGAFGVDVSREGMLQRQLDFEQRFIRLRNQGGLNAQQGTALQGTIDRVAQRSGVTGRADLLGALEVAQNRFSNLDFFADEGNLDAVAKFVEATGSTMEDAVGLAGELNRQFGVSGSQLGEALAIAAQSARAGSVEASDIAGGFSPVLGTFSQVTGMRGIEAQREAFALFQGLGQSGRTDPTLAQNLLAKLSNADVLEKLQGAGVSVRDDAGNFVGFERLISQIATSENLDQSPERQEVFGRDMQANQALDTLIQAYRADPEFFRKLRDVDVSEGQQVIEQTSAELRGSTSARIGRAVSNAEANFAENSDAYVEQMASMVERTAELESKYPGLIQKMEMFGTVLGSVGLGGLGGSMLSGGLSTAGGGRGIAAGGAAAAGLKTAAGVSGVLGAGLVGFGVGSLIADQIQEGAAERRRNWINDPENMRRARESAARDAQAGRDAARVSINYASGESYSGTRADLEQRVASGNIGEGLRADLQQLSAILAANGREASNLSTTQRRLAEAYNRSQTAQPGATAPVETGAP